MKLLGIFTLLLLAQISNCHIALGSCNLQCEAGGETESNTSPPNLPLSSLQGRVGKAGPKGAKGEKGEAAEECECLNIEELKLSILPKSCAEFVPNHGVGGTSGVFTIYPYGNLTSLRVYCDLETDGGGWLIFQKRIDGSVDFYRNFEDYVKGFGNLNGEFWLGLKDIHSLTKDGEYEMRVDVEDFENQTRYAFYSDFSVGAGTDYTLSIGGYSGTAGNSLAGQGHGSKFSAKDFDQDKYDRSCSETYKGGWWYGACHGANPNGLYLKGRHESYADSVIWAGFRGAYYSLKRIEMKLRKK